MKSPQVLVVDDDAAVLERLLRMVPRSGHSSRRRRELLPA
jgi:CheY-like chemotaxis protein